ncbi:ABC transporter ATP-binding protein [Nonomuraea sp. NPDC048916]|uniref:ABC transporter ATP-binding protein n=1 Tax=Nonomuraea sp. NPDC048916 TaxID=3154232 RepID=UPI0033F2597D
MSETCGEPPPAIHIDGLTKTFHQGRRTLMDRLARRPDQRAEVAAVDGLDLTIGQAEIFGLLGPNGAGKSTTVRMIATLLEPTAGTVRLGGVDVAADPEAARRHLGVVLGGERSVYWKLTGRENLEYFAALYQIPRAQWGPRIQAVLEEMDLSERADDYVERYSTGMRQRLAIARALLPEPAVLLLDEPTAGLDPQAALHLRERISRLRAAGRSVVLTTHYMDEAEELCDRVAIIDGGRIVALGTPAELRSLVNAAQVVRVQFEDVSADAEAALVERIGRVADVVDKEHEGAALTLTLHVSAGEEPLPRVIDVSLSLGVTLRRVDVEPVTLEDVFLSVTGRSLRE